MWMDPTRTMAAVHVRTPLELTAVLLTMEEQDSQQQIGGSDSSALSPGPEPVRQPASASAGLRTTTVPTQDGHCIRLLVPASKVGSVLGRGGTIVKSIREDTGARVRVCDQSDNCVERAIIISAGSAADSSPAEAQAQLEHAMLLVYRAVLHPVTEESVAQLMTQPIDEPADTPTEQRLLIHRSLTGCLIGHGGEAAKQLQKETGAKLYIQPDSDVPHTHGSTSVDRVVRITGTLKTLPLALVNTARKLRQNVHAHPRNESFQPTNGQTATQVHFHPRLRNTVAAAASPAFAGASASFTPRLHSPQTAPPALPPVSQMQMNAMPSQLEVQMPMQMQQPTMMPGVPPLPPPPPPSMMPAQQVPRMVQVAQPGGYTLPPQQPPPQLYFGMIPNSSASQPQNAIAEAQLSEPDPSASSDVGAYEVANTGGSG